MCVILSWKPSCHRGNVKHFSYPQSDAPSDVIVLEDDEQPDTNINAAEKKRLLEEDELPDIPDFKAAEKKR